MFIIIRSSITALHHDYNDVYLIIAAIFNWFACFLIASLLFYAPNFHPSMFWRVGCNYILTIIAAILIPLGLIPTTSHSSQIALGISQIILSIITSLILFLFPLPSASPLSGPYTFIGTLSFTIKLDISDTESRDQDPNDLLPLQCWFPIKPTTILQYFYWKFIASKALLWTSGNSSEQYYESIELLKQIAIRFEIPLFAL